jgi:hypothetical protein
MITSRVSFGCAVDNYSATIFTVGGKTGLTDFSNICEAYSIKDNKWTTLPSMNEKKSSTSLCLFNDNSLFVFGG